MPDPTMYRYKDPTTGQVFDYGDPTINREAILSKGLTFVSGPVNPNQTNVPQDPLQQFRYTGGRAVPGTGAGGVVGARAGAFAPGGAYDSSVKPYTAEEQANLRKEQLVAVQRRIDAVNELANQELAGASVRAAGRLGSARAVSAATGTIGSPIGDTAQEEISGVNVKERAAIEAQKAAKIEEILTGVENKSMELIKMRKDEARLNADEYIKYLGGVADEARGRMKSLAQAGAELSDTQKSALIDQTGYDPATFDTLYKSMNIASSTDIINKDKPQIVGNKAIFFKQTKDKNGNVTLGTVELDLPEVEKGKEIDSTVARDDGIYVFYKDGTWKKVGDPKPPSTTDTEKDAEKAKAGKDAKSEALNNYNVANEVLSKENDIASITGLKGARTILTGGTATQYTKNQILQLKNSISLENRGKMKGQGQISNYEGELLASASTALGPTEEATFNLKNEDLIREIKKIRAAFALSAGLKASVKVVKDGQTVDEGSLTEDEILSAIEQGYQIEYN